MALSPRKKKAERLQRLKKPQDVLHARLRPGFPILKHSSRSFFSSKPSKKLLNQEKLAPLQDYLKLQTRFKSLSAEQIARRKKRKMRRDADGRNVAAADAFPELAGAPRVAPRGGGGDADGVGARPLGVQIRATQCLRCGGFGHASGDRECTMRAHNPNDAFRAKTEDPLSLMRAREALAASREFQLTRAAHASAPPARSASPPTHANARAASSASSGPPFAGPRGARRTKMDAVSRSSSSYMVTGSNPG